MQSKPRSGGGPHIRYGANNGPDGGGNTGGYGGGGGGGSGGGGGVRSAPPHPQQDKAPPQQQIALHHPAPNPMISYHAPRPPAQPPPGGATLPPGYIYHTGTLRPPPARQISTPRPGTTLIPFYQENPALSPLCTQFYSTVPLSMMYPPGGGSSESGRAPPPGPYPPWSANPSAQPQVIMAQPPTPQPNPQQQPQPQPSPYPQGQYATFIPRVHQSYTTTGGGSGSGGGPGVQTAPQTAVIVDQRQMQVGSTQQGKSKGVRSNRIPIIHPETGKEVIVEGESAAVPGGASGGSGATQERTGGSGHPHTQLQPATTNQVRSGNALVAANYTDQSLVAMKESTTRVPRDTEEPQVNGPGSAPLMGPVVGTGAAPVEEPAPPPVVNSQSVSTPNKRPPGPTPVVSAQAEGLTYDIQSIRNNVNKVEIRSSESSPAKSKVTMMPVQHALSSDAAPIMHHPVIAQPVQQHTLQLSQPLHHHPPPLQPPVLHSVQAPPPVPPVQPVMPPHPVTQPLPESQSPIQTQSQQKPHIEQQPKQQRRPREEKKPQSVKPPVQVEEKEETPRSRTPSSSNQAPASKEEEPAISSPVPSVVKPTPAEKSLPLSHQEKASPQIEKSQPLREEKVHQKENKPVEKVVERSPVPEPVPEKQTTTEVPKTDSEKPEKPATQKPLEKRNSPAPITVAATPAPNKPKTTTFAEGFSLPCIKVSAKAAAQQVAAVTANAAQTQAAQQSETSDSSDAPHSQGKPMGRKSKSKQKQREMNQKGVEKEGTDMDAFIDTNARDNNNKVANDLTSRLSGTETKVNDVKQDVTAVNQRNADVRNSERPSNDNSISNKNLTDNGRADSREKSPAHSADLTNNNINNQIAQETDDIEDSGDDMVTAKNQENSNKTNLEDSELLDLSTQVISASLPSLKYRYRDDQWSPVNPSGKKVYDRDFLMKLREDPQSSKKPDITADVEIFVKDSQGGGGGGGSGAMRRNPSSHGPYSGFGGSASMRNSSNNGLFPEFRTSLSQRMPVKRNSQGSGGNRMSGGQRSLKPIYGLNLRDEYKLVLSENAWKPTKLTRAQEIKSKEERDTDELYKKVRGILNKLTPQKFDTLVLQFQNLPISSLERLQGVIRLVFEKAVDEPAFSVSYANLCKVLAKLQVSENSMGGVSVSQNQDPNAQGKQPVLFRKLLITRCQQEFETNKKLELDFEKRQQDINETPDPDKRKEMQLLFNEDERKIRMRSVGLVTFIGELFKLKMLTANIMHGCIKQLLGKIDEESLECLCKLLTTIGREFEEQISSSKTSQGGLGEFNEYFQQMAKLSKKHEGSRVSSRVRFMLQDVIELRLNSWVPRRDENKPKTMAQIQEEVEMESVKAQNQTQMHRVAQNTNQDRGQQRRNNPRSNQSEDGWTNVTGKQYSRNTNYAAEATKIQGLRVSMASQEFDRGSRGETVLGSMLSSYGKWGAGAGSSTRTQSSGSAFMDVNSFSPLLDSGDRKGSQAAGRITSLKICDSKEADKKDALITTAAFMRQQSSGEKDPKDRDGSRGRGITGGNSSLPLSTPPAMRKPLLNEQPPQRSLDLQRRSQNDAGRSAESSRESTPGPASQADKSRTEPTLPVHQPVDEEDLKKSAVSIIIEYISNTNVEDCIEYFKERFIDSGTVFVSTCLNFIVEQTKREKRQRTSQLLGELLKHQQYPPSLLVSELQVFFETIYDLAVDIPHIWQYLGEVFGDIMCIGVIDFSHLKEASSVIPESSSNKLESTLREVFKILLLDKVPLTVKKIWDSSNVQIKDFISDKTTSEKFLADFAFLEGKEVVANDSNLPFQKVEEKLLSFLKINEDFDAICCWLTVHLGKRTEDPKFIRHLTEAVIKSSVSMDSATKTYKFDKNILNKNLKFIKRYVDNNEELELWCLYSVQYVVVNTLESPSGMLVEIFKELFEYHVISPEGFNKWRQDDDKCAGWQNEGRGVAIASSKSFFQAMEQEMNDDQDDEPS